MENSKVQTTANFGTVDEVNFETGSGEVVDHGKPFRVSYCYSPYFSKVIGCCPTKFIYRTHLYLSQVIPTVDLLEFNRIYSRLDNL